MTLRSFFILYFFSFVFCGISAQQNLSLDQCRNLAIENNKSLKIASENIRKAHYEKKEALMNFFPKINASGNFMNFSKDLKLIGSHQLPGEIPIPGIGNIPIPDDIREAIANMTKINTDQLWLVGISATQPLFMGGRIVAYNDLRKYAEELAKTMKETKSIDVIVETDQAYWQVVSIANKVKLAEAYTKLLSEMEFNVQQLLDNGMATKADKLSVSVKLNEAEISLTKARNGLVLSKMLLCEIIGLPISSDISIEDENLDSLKTENTDLPFPADIEEAVNNRTEIKSLHLVDKIYKQQEKIAFANFLPEAGIKLGYYSTKPNVFNGVSNTFGGLWNIAVQVKVPLNFITNSAKLNAAKAESAMHHYELMDAKDKIKLQIHQASFKLEEANKVLHEATKNVEKANENLRYANEGFDEGVMSSVEALAAHTAWMTAQTEKLDAEIDLKLCKVYFDQAVGNINQ